MNTTEHAEEAGRFVSVQTLAEIYEVTPRTVRNWTKIGIIPQPMRISNTCIRYDLDAVKQAIEERNRPLKRLFNGE